MRVRPASVVAFEDDLLPLPTQFLQAIPVTRYHFIQPTNVGVNVINRLAHRPGIRGAFARVILADSPHQFLHVATLACPSIVSSAERLEIKEIWPNRRDPLEILLIIKLGLIASSIHQPDLSPL